MRVNTSFLWFVLLVIHALVTPAYNALAAVERYDLVYIWDKDIESVLDYKDQLEQIFDNDVTSRLKIVGRDDEYGVIYDTNGSARNVIQELARHGDVLRKAGLKEAWAMKDEGYHLLYNVSYGLGPHLDPLKVTYDKLYGYLGKEVGKNLFIEKTNSNNYTLIFRCRGGQISTTRVAQAHAKLLRGKKIRTSITPENNNEIVYGESSLLDDSGNETVGSSTASAPIVQETAGTVESAAVPDDSIEVTTTTTSIEVATVSDTSAVQSSSLSESGGKLTAISPVQTKKVNSNVVAVSKQAEQNAASSTVKDVTVVTSKSGTEFERNIEQFIKELRRKGAIRSDEKTGWMVYDLENDRSLVDINANEVFQAASMIKPFVALAYFHEVKRGKLVYGTKGRQMVEAMIQRSSNSATNWVMKQVGGPARCEQILHSNYKRIFKNTAIKEYIPASGRTYKNSALPSDYIRYLRALWNNELPYDKEMRRIMAMPGRDRLYHGTKIPQGTLVYNKTGSTAHLIGDMGIIVPKTVKGRRYPYAIVGIIERSSRAPDYGRWMLARGNVIRQVSTLVYEEMKKKNRLM